MDIQRTEKYLNDMINELINEWGVSESFALRLLKKFSWNKDKALTHLTEDGNFEMMDTHVTRHDKTVCLCINFDVESLFSLIVLSAILLSQFRVPVLMIVVIFTARIALKIT